MGRLAKSDKSFLDREFGERSFDDLSENFSDDVFRREWKPQPVEFDFKKALEGIVFVIMPFADAMDQTHATIVEQCEKLGLKAVRVDDKPGSGIVLRDILTLIEVAELIVCDLTDARANVLYELGYAHGVGNHSNNVLLIVAHSKAEHEHSV